MLQRTYVRDALVIGAATGVFGVAFGVLATTTGFSVAQAGALSVLVFTGASQFAAVSVAGAGGDPITALGSALLLGARNAFYGMTMSAHVKGSLLKRAVAAQLTIDESAALAIGQRKPEDIEPAFWAAGLSVFVFWNLGTLAGALGGDAIGHPSALGLDAAFPAGFIALVMPALRTRAGRVAAVSGLAIAMVALPVTRPGLPIVLAAVGALVAHATVKTEPPAESP
ncbi:MAG: AzlC family ABC transporter permease [Actinomycetota bacterium]|nr:AzlC family ABC transporter permease [Actinomycetota bacterium]